MSAIALPGLQRRAPLRRPGLPRARQRARARHLPGRDVDQRPPWTFSVWDHLGGDVLRAQLERRGFVVGSASTAVVWLDLPGPVPAPRPAPAAPGAPGRHRPGRPRLGRGPRPGVRSALPPRWPRRGPDAVVRLPRGRARRRAGRRGEPATADGVAVLYHSACCPGRGGRASGRLLVERHAPRRGRAASGPAWPRWRARPRCPWRGRSGAVATGPGCPRMVPGSVAAAPCRTGRPCRPRASARSGSGSAR